MSVSTLFFAILAFFIAFVSIVQSSELLEVNEDSNANIPVLMMHGIGGTFHDFDGMQAAFKRLRPNIPTFSLDVNNKGQSFGNLQNQMVDVQKKIVELQNQHKFSKFHLICHSQGALLCRTLAAYWDNHQIQNLVLLSGPLLGQYGVPPAPLLPDALKSITTAGAHILLYTNTAQAHFSIANMWKDPFFYNDYLNSNKFLSRLYNESRSSDDIHHSRQLKNNFLRVSRVYLFGSDGDEVIIPWQSAILSFWEKGGNSKMLPLQSHEFYVNDYCGFKQLNQNGRLIIKTVPQIGHNEWPRNQELIAKYIIPLF